MATSNLAKWKEGTDYPYVLQDARDYVLAIRLPAEWLKADHSGQPLLLPPAVRALDRLRALFTPRPPLTPGFIASLREAMGLNQEEFGRKLRVSKMTVSRWERGRMHPSKSAENAIRQLQRNAQGEGVKIDGKKRTSKHRVVMRLPR